MLAKMDIGSLETVTMYQKVFSYLYMILFSMPQNNLMAHTDKNI